MLCLSYLYKIQSQFEKILAHGLGAAFSSWIYCVAGRRNRCNKAHSGDCARYKIKRFWLFSPQEEQPFLWHILGLVHVVYLMERQLSWLEATIQTTIMWQGFTFFIINICVLKQFDHCPVWIFHLYFFSFISIYHLFIVLSQNSTGDSEIVFI